MLPKHLLNMQLALFCFVFTLFLLETESFGVNYWKLREKVEEHRQLKGQKSYKAKFFKRPELILGTPHPDQYYEQPLDHFDPLMPGTYNQRYWVNKDYWNEKSGPVFLYIGGEGALNSGTVEYGHHVEMAEKHEALIFAVEHRYYGESINDDGLELNSIKFLSSQQALADLARFHLFASKQFNLTEDRRWICFGGSYPGALSAWFRLKYPHLVHGAIASSAPVEAEVNFEGYNNVVAASLSTPIVNGSAKCSENVRAAFQTIDELLDKKQYSRLEKDFRSCKPLRDDHDVYQLVSNAADVFMGTVQYNGEAPGLDITRLCTAMTQPGDPYQNLLNLEKEFLAQTNQECTDNSWENFIGQLSNTTVVRGGGVGMRQWLYQTCTQFGYYQTCDKNTNCLFSKRMSLGPNLDICKQVFSIARAEVAQRVDFTNAYYGADRPKGTRIVFVNGSIDPWHALSVLKSLSATETAIYIPGTAHCANMASDSPSLPAALKLARKKIEKQIAQWLEDDKPSGEDTRLYFKPSSQ